MEQPKETNEFRFSISNDDFLNYGNQVLEEMKTKITLENGWTIVEPNYEGLRVSCPDEKGWFLLRMSLHDPVIPLNIESDMEGGIELIAAKLKNLLVDFEGLNISVLI